MKMYALEASRLPNTDPSGRTIVGLANKMEIGESAENKNNQLILGKQLNRAIVEVRVLSHDSERNVQK